MTKNLNYLMILLTAWILSGQLKTKCDSAGYTYVPDKTIEKMINQNKQAEKNAVALKLSQDRYVQTLLTLDSADQSIDKWKTAYSNEKIISDTLRQAAALYKEINRILFERAEEGNYLAVAGATGAGFYLAGGKFRKPEWVIGSMLTVYGFQKLTGWTFDLFSTVNVVNPF